MAVGKLNVWQWSLVLAVPSFAGCVLPYSKPATYSEEIVPVAPASISQSEGKPDVALVDHQEPISVIQPPVLEPTNILPPETSPSDIPAFEVAQATKVPAIPTSTASGLTLAQLQDLALANNPTIRQISASAQAASDYRYQVGLSANPVVGYSGSQLADQNTDQHLVTVDREFVTAGKLDLNRNVLGHAVEAQKWDVESQRYRVLTDVRLAFVDALVAQRRMDVIDDFHGVVAKGAELAQKRFEAKEASQSDQLQAEIQLNEVEVLRQQAQFAWDAAWQEMAATAGVPNMQRSQLSGELNPQVGNLEWEAIYSDLLGNSPELRASYSRVHQARANMSRQEVQHIPNILAGIQAGHDNSTGSGMINVTVGAPIPVFNDNSGNVSAAYREYCRATHAVKRIEMSLKARLAGVAKEYDSALVAVERYEQQILPKAKRTLDLSEQAYAAGEFSFIQVLIVRRTYFDTNLQYISALGELAKAHAKIDGLLLTGGLDEPTDFQGSDALRGQTFSQQ
ncbi:Cobalt-zinc-cadmium resistance protein CzcC precursor [Bremerella volcania]|uniref:Cobalt-zinc-cadmium resistance protein CzcC n=1 Tax=Bremerella volcania TaxID=2527984 RepID=A0A518CGD9_9BACT|nr:TolC family protein [Bremerella volcania]QDU78290.1 Cobalt-zinc-cadmium resistance protein CzcC precursor [Bremerella volcania]